MVLLIGSDYFDLGICETKFLLLQPDLFKKVGDFGFCTVWHVLDLVNATIICQYQGDRLCLTPAAEL